MDVAILKNTLVKSYDGDRVVLDSGQVIKSKNVIWAVGVTGNMIGGFPQAVITRSNRLKVDRINKVSGYGNIYAIGDIACMETPKYPNGHP